MGGSKSKISQIKNSNFNTEKLETLETNYDEFTRNPDTLFNKYSEEISQWFKIYLGENKISFPEFVEKIEILLHGKTKNEFKRRSYKERNQLLLQQEGTTPFLLQCLGVKSDVIDYLDTEDLNNDWPILDKVLIEEIKRGLFGGNSMRNPPSATEGIMAHIVDVVGFSTLNIQGPLHPLYMSAKDGLSFSRMAHLIVGYDGPTVLLILHEQGLLGVYIGGRIRDSAKYHGSVETFLFTFQPKFATFRAGHQSNYVYLNSRNITDKYPKGLGFGGTPTEARIWLDDEIETNSYVTEVCETFVAGKLAPEHRIKVNQLEIWGCGGEEALEALQDHQDFEYERIMKSRKVDKAAFVDNDFNKEFLLGKTFNR